MKKNILLLGLLLSALYIYSQPNYVLEYDLIFKIQTSDRRYHLNEFRYATASGNTQKIRNLVFYGTHGIIPKKETIKIPVSNGPINQIVVWGVRQFKDGWPLGWNTKCESTKTIYSDYSNTGYFFELTSLALPCFDGRWELTVNKFIFRPDLEIQGRMIGGEIAVKEGNMGDDDILIINATAGFPSAVYKWQYSTNSTVWQNLPAKFISNDSTVQLKANELLTETELLAQYNKAVFFRITYDYGNNGSNVLTYTLNKSSPHIINKEITPNKCKGDSEAKIKLTFDRPLLPNETMNVEYGISTDKIEINSENPMGEGNTVILTGLPEGKVPIQVSGEINNISNYSDGISHKDSVFIVDPEPVEMTVSDQRHISCYEGNDGAFRVNASGGVKNYKLFLKQESVDDDFREIPFPSAEATSIYVDNLQAGTYKLYIVDGNDCQCRDKLNYASVEQLILNQPPAPMEKVGSDMKNPTGFGLTNGYVAINVTGGTLKADNSYNVVWKDKSGSVLSSVYNEYNEVEHFYSSILSNIGDGEYTVEITDKNYAGAYPNCNASCVVRDTFTLVQPPPLVVSIKETHYISCWGDSDGELTAYAEGGAPFDAPFRYKYTWFRVEADKAIELETDSVQGDLTSGYYRVRVEDQSGNVTVSSNTLLPQPDKLVIYATGSEIPCNGNSVGSVGVTATGGTPPYLYEWNTGDETQSVQDLPIGVYEVKVSDTRNCFQKATAVISSPDQMEISTVVTHPVCYGEKNGSIQVSVTGGRPPYTYQWDTGSPDKDLFNIGAGTYRLIVSDINGCTISHSDTLVYPEPLKIELGPDRTLCRDQSLTLSPEVEDNSSTFLWLKNGEFFSSSKQVTITEEGIYTIEQTDSRSCKARDTINIQVADVEISSEFIVASNVFRNDTILFVNISDPFPEQAEWIIADNPKVKVVETNEHYVRIIFSENGLYTIGFRSRVGECFREIYKDIVVIEPEDFFSTDEFLQDLILHFSVHPNPNSGIFSATIELEKKASIRLRLVNLSTGTTLSDIRLYGETDYLVPYDLPLSSGTYGLILETAAGKAIVKIIAF